MDLAQQGRYRDALALCQAELEASPDQPDLLHAAALCHLRERNPALAESLLRRAIAADGSQAHFHNTLGNVLRDTGRSSDAISEYQAAMHLAPGYYDPHYNLGVLHRRAGQLQPAVTHLLKALELRRTVQALNALGLAYQDMERFPESVLAFQEALKVNPGYTDALHNLGVTFNRFVRPESSVTCFDEVIARNPGLPQAYYNRGNAHQLLGNFTDAIADYESAIRLSPFMVEAHVDLNKLLWILGNKDQCLSSFRAIIGKTGTPPSLELAYINALLQAGELDAATTAAETALRGQPDSAPLLLLLSTIHTEAGKHEAAARASAAALGRANSSSDCLIKHARDLIMTGHPDLALTHLLRALEMDPDDQLTWACIGVCWEQLGDPRYGALCNYDEFVQEYELKPAAAYKDMQECNQVLIQVLNEAHNTRAHPPDQTLRNGTQTIGSLFKRDIPVIHELVRSLDQAIALYIDHLATLDIPLQGFEHPLLRRINKQFRYAGSWSVRLAPGGFHINHVHSRGWVSSAYYVSLPESPPGGIDANPGDITFGQTELLGPQAQPKRIIRPKPGRLVLFPSYFWHGTIPFTTGPFRMTVAFDVVPATDR